MAFDPLERSAAKGRPEELYEFWMADKFWRYTSADTPRTLRGYVFEPIRGLRRTALKQDKDGGDDTLQVTMPGDLDFAWQFRILVPARRIWMRIYRRHRQDVGNDDEYIQVFYGRVRGCGWKGTKAIIECDGLNSTFKRSGLRLNFDVNCPHMLYGPGCNLDKDQFRLDGPVMEIGTNYVRCANFASKPDGWLRLGYIEFGRYYYMLADHVGDKAITFNNLEYDLEEKPLVVTAYAGCDRTLRTCWDKFNNGLNAEANAWHPEQNPFVKGL